LLGHYVLGLERRNLRLAVWSGRVVLENLSLRPDALLGLVPAKLQVGTIGRLEMVVPWHKLGSMPVSLELHDVYVLATPLNEETSWRPEAEEARRWSKKQAALRTRGGELRELLAELQGSLETADDDSITPGLLGLILDNVQVTVSTVHLRYEDRITSSAPCALGVRLAGLHVKSIDEEGRTRDSFHEMISAGPPHGVWIAGLDALSPCEGFQQGRPKLTYTRLSHARSPSHRVSLRPRTPRAGRRLGLRPRGD
jgi:vacuolar protein sorting-associated protein 13A/C